MFRFTIRDVLWLMVVVGLAVGWSVEYATVRQERAALAVERELAKAKRREADAAFLRLIDANDEVNRREQSLNQGRK